jgi:hypothetical protein
MSFLATTDFIIMTTPAAPVVPCHLAADPMLLLEALYLTQAAEILAFVPRLQFRFVPRWIPHIPGLWINMNHNGGVVVPLGIRA